MYVFFKLLSPRKPIFEFAFDRCNIVVAVTCAFYIVLLHHICVCKRVIIIFKISRSRRRTEGKKTKTHNQRRKIKALQECI